MTTLTVNGMTLEVADDSHVFFGNDEQCVFQDWDGIGSEELKEHSARFAERMQAEIDQFMRLVPSCQTALIKPTA